MRIRKHARGLSLLLCAALLAGQPGTTIYAEGTASDTEGLCEHHPEHTTAVVLRLTREYSCLKTE